ncbi:MAG: hypothetical protein J5929_01425 [Eubacterium sp.]|nr:hypothetical protein [Eubacterium sp.]
MSKRSGDSATPFYKRKNAYKKSARFALFGCLLMLASAFLYWKNLFFRISEKQYTGISFFSVARKCFKMGISAKTLILPILLLVFLAAIVFLSIAAIKDNISKKPFFDRNKKRIRFGVLLLTILLVIFMVHTPIFSENERQLSEIHNSWKGLIDASRSTYIKDVGEMFSYYTIGPGFISYIVGLMLYVISVCYSFVLDTLNEDDD